MKLKVGQIFEHVKTKYKYRIIALGRMEKTEVQVVIYSALVANEYDCWVRPLQEFTDGRFKICDPL